MGFVQLAGGHTQASSATNVIPVTVTTAAGDLLLLSARQTNIKHLLSVADTKGNTWAADQPGSNTQSGCAQASCVIGAGKALVPGDTITATFTGSCTSACGVAEFTGPQVTAGAATPDILMDTGQVSGTGAAVTSGTSAAGGELAVSCIGGSAGADVFTITAADASSGGTWTPLAYGLGGLGAAYQYGPAPVTAYTAAWAGTGTTTNCEAMVATYLLAAGFTPSSPDASGAALDTHKVGVNDAIGLP